MIVLRGAVLALLLAACGREDAADADRAASSDFAAPAAAVDPAAQRAPGPDSPASDGAVVLAPDGVGFGGAPRLAFGEGQGRVVADARAALGEPDEQGLQEECPAGPLGFVQWTGGLQLVFQDSAFVGWSARPGTTLRTAAGIGPGSTAAEVKAAYPASTVEQTSLGTEFSAGDLYGVMAEDADRVDHLYAGINCIFR